MPDEALRDQERPSAISDDSIREELARIAASKPFANAARSRRFLSFVVERTLDGEQNAVKELVLGIEVFDRPSGFDPRTDTIVRVEAGKLRKRLHEYYETEGSDAVLRIQMPKGSYVPRFELAEEMKPVPAGALPQPRPGSRTSWTLAFAGAAAAVLLIGAFLYTRAASPSADPSVAVLPFQNYSPDSANEYFADGLTEDLTDSLARLGGIRVVSRTSAFFFKGKRADIHEIAEKLHAEYVVEGSVRKDGQRLKITAQLIRGSDGFHVWSNSFEHDVEDIFGVQQEIAQAIASVLEQKLAGTNKQRLARHYSANVEAFDFYMRGRHAASTGFLADIDEPERLQRAAIAVDPGYPLPYVALADLYLRADILTLRPSLELYAKAKEAVSKALALDGGIAEAHTILGTISARHEYDWAAAESHLRHALELDPNSASAHNALAHNVLAPQGRWQEAVAESRKALELDPYSTSIALGEPWLEFLQRNYNASLTGFRVRGLSSPNDPILPFSIATALLGKGDFDGALAVSNPAEKARGAAPPPFLLGLTAYAHARSGRLDAARLDLSQIVAASKGHFASSGPLAMAYAGLNDRDQWFACMERARENHESYLIFTRVDPLIDTLRSDSRYQQLLDELGLSDSAIAKATSKNEALSKRVHR